MLIEIGSLWLSTLALHMSDSPGKLFKDTDSKIMSQTS